MEVKSLHVVVVYGGISTERQVALNSGKAMYQAMLRAGFTNVELFDLTADNLGQLLAKKPDVCVLALHGKGGEDGCIQGALELAGIPYTGSGVEASAIAMDKVTAKLLLSQAGLPTAKYCILPKDACADREKAADVLIDALGLPMVLKSPCQGSSIGVVIVHSREEVSAAMDEVFSYGDRLLAEEFLDGTELTVPVLGNRELKAFPVIEITSENEFYDLESKYTPGMCHHIIPARISEKDCKEVERLAMMTHSLLGCRGYSRVDFILDKKKGPMVIELNSLPGMTDMSLYPDSARSVGVSYEELVTKFVELAME